MARSRSADDPIAAMPAPAPFPRRTLRAMCWVLSFAVLSKAAPVIRPVGGAPPATPFPAQAGVAAGASTRCVRNADNQAAASAGAALTAGFSELGGLNRGQIAATHRAAPIAHGDGATRGQRRAQGGRFEIRRGPHLPTPAAMSHHPVGAAQDPDGVPPKGCRPSVRSPACASCRPRSTPWSGPMRMSPATDRSAAPGFVEGCSTPQGA